MNLDLASIQRRVAGQAFWERYLSAASADEAPIGMHVAVFAEPFLTHVLNGAKTTESRFSRVRCAPFEEVSDGDVILIKKVAGPICGIALAHKTWCYDLTYEPLERIRDRHGEAICADEAFWDAQRDANYATLIELSHQAALDAVPFEKRDRRGWVSLRSRQLGMAF